MNKKVTDIELKVYELLGIKTFRKIAFKGRDFFWTFITPNMSKEERHEKLYYKPGNYIMKKGNGVQDLIDFKKMLLFNATIHTVCFLYNLPSFSEIISGTASISDAMLTIFCMLINAYCVMLQRYNHIRINRVIERMKPREERKKNEIKEELTKNDSLFSEHTYKIINEHNDEKVIDFDELIENSSYEELKILRQNFLYFASVNEMLEKQNRSITGEEIFNVPLQKNKTLKFELRARKRSEDINE